jgi:hypothetical protein
MKEAARNRLLRRVDWRFLLPDPNPARTLCLAEELIEPLAAISSEVLRDGPVAERSSCDLAVAIDPEPATLKRAWASMHPGGACYTEWRRLPGGWRAVTGRLEKAGFEGVACYWPRPDPVRRPAAVWIPLADRGPLEYYRGHRRSTRNPLRIAGRAARKLQLAFTPRQPICAIARKPETAAAVGPGSAPAEIAETIRSSWSRWGLGQSPPRVSCMLRAAPGRSGGKVVALFFAPGARSPAVAAKMARTAESAGGLGREADVLALLDRREIPVHGAPRVLHCRPGAVVETAAPGLPISGLVRRGTFRSLAERGAAWLVELAGPDEGIRRSRQDVVDRFLGDFESRYGPVVEARFLQRIRGILSDLPPLRRVVEHRDFAPWNVLSDEDGELAILDWESAEPDGLPALDLIYFLTYLALRLDRNMRSGRHVETFRNMLDPASLAGSVSKDCLDWYSDRTGTPREAIRPLRLLTWLVHSGSEYRHMAEDSGGPPDHATLRRSVFLDFLKEEIRFAAGATD